MKYFKKIFLYKNKMKMILQEFNNKEEKRWMKNQNFSFKNGEFTEEEKGYLVTGKMEPKNIINNLKSQEEKRYKKRIL